MNSRAYPIGKPGRRLRTLTLVYGLLLFVWLTPEDDTLWTATLLGVGLSLLVLVWWVGSRLGGRAIPAAYLPVGGVIAGAIVGVGAALCTASLMFFKNALHAHPFWDYPPSLVAAMLGRAPVWLLAGGLVGLGLGLLWLWQAARSNESIKG